MKDSWQRIDFLGRPIKVGSTVVYAATHARAEALRKGIVVGVAPRLLVRAFIPSRDGPMRRTIALSTGARVIVFPRALTDREIAALKASQPRLRRRTPAHRASSTSTQNDEALAWLRRQLEGLRINEGKEER